MKLCFVFVSADMCCWQFKLVVVGPCQEQAERIVEGIMPHHLL